MSGDSIPGPGRIMYSNLLSFSDHCFRETADHAHTMARLVNFIVSKRGRTLNKVEEFEEFKSFKSRKVFPN